MESPPLPDPPPWPAPGAGRPRARRPAARRRRPAARARIVAGVLSVLAFLGIGVAAAAGDRTPTVAQRDDGAAEAPADPGWGAIPGWGAEPGSTFPGQPPVTGSHGS
jgi:hypothetical protein